jgi:tripartite ATP-independent transporter DctM subunit
MPVGFSLALVGFLGLGYLRNMDIGLRFLGTIPYTTTASFTFCVIPLFVLMGTFCYYSAISRDLYNSAYSWVGHYPGGIAMATITGCAGFAALCGDSLTTAVTMGTVSLPEMKRFKYDPALATGSVAAGGTIGILIPPSIGFILYGLLTNQSIGALFIAGILPGLLLTFLFIIYIYIRCHRNPDMGPAGIGVTFKEKLISLKGIWSMVVLFALVIGGIYMGLFTPTEAGAIGAFGALVIGLLQKRFSWETFSASLLDAGKITAMVFIILIGADIFSYFLAVSKLPFQLADFVGSLPLPRLLLLIIILFIYLVLGCLMPALAMIILTLPIFYPIVDALGFEPIWFGVIMVIMLEMAVITPPIGINVFAVSGVAKDVPMSTIFRGILPFFLVMIVCLAILIAFPQLATILPKIMGFMK